jgi:hypothetical protein
MPAIPNEEPKTRIGSGQSPAYHRCLICGRELGWFRRWLGCALCWRRACAIEYESRDL